MPRQLSLVEQWLDTACVAGSYPARATMIQRWSQTPEALQMVLAQENALGHFRRSSRERDFRFEFVDIRFQIIDPLAHFAEPDESPADATITAISVVTVMGSIVIVIRILPLMYVWSPYHRVGRPQKPDTITVSSQRNAAPSSVAGLIVSRDVIIFRKADGLCRKTDLRDAKP